MNNPLHSTAPHLGCNALNPICSAGQCVCSVKSPSDVSNPLKCESSESTWCTARGLVETPESITSGVCMCGVATACVSTSSTPACLLEIDGSEPDTVLQPTTEIKTGTSCQVYQFCFLFNSRFIDQYIFICVYLSTFRKKRKNQNLKI
jgi:hypothetical protein